MGVTTHFPASPLPANSARSSQHFQDISRSEIPGITHLGLIVTKHNCSCGRVRGCGTVTGFGSSHPTQVLQHGCAASRDAHTPTPIICTYCPGSVLLTKPSPSPAPSSAVARAPKRFPAAPLQTGSPFRRPAGQEGGERRVHSPVPYRGAQPASRGHGRPGGSRPCPALLPQLHHHVTSWHPTASSNHKTTEFCNKTATSCNCSSEAMCPSGVTDAAEQAFGSVLLQRGGGKRPNQTCRPRARTNSRAERLPSPAPHRRRSRDPPSNKLLGCSDCWRGSSGTTDHLCSGSHRSTPDGESTWTRLHRISKNVIATKPERPPVRQEDNIIVRNRKITASLHRRIFGCKHPEASRQGCHCKEPCSQNFWSQHRF